MGKQFNVSSLVYRLGLIEMTARNTRENLSTATEMQKYVPKVVLDPAEARASQQRMAEIEGRTRMAMSQLQDLATFTNELMAELNNDGSSNGTSPPQSGSGLQLAQ